MLDFTSGFDGVCPGRNIFEVPKVSFDIEYSLYKLNILKSFRIECSATLKDT